jgi:recombination DNA repair RAD52 pathway protein
MTFIKEYEGVKKLETLSPHETFANILNRRSPFTANDVQLIQGWMTFDYVNKIFGLPSNDLETSFDITDASYPRETLARYAERHHMNTAVFIDEVQNAVREFLTKAQ